MTRRITLISALLVALLPGAAWAQAEAPQVPRPTVAVLAFDTSRTGWMPPPGFGATVAELLTDRLVAAGPFRIIDCTVITPDDERSPFALAAARDRAANSGVQFLIVGAVTRLSLEHRTSTGGGLLPIPVVAGLVRKHKTESIVGLTLRVIDVRTGEIVVTASAEGGASGTTTSGGGVGLVGKLPIIGGKSSSATGIQDGLLAGAIQDAVASVAEQLTTAAARLAVQRFQ